MLALITVGSKIRPSVGRSSALVIIVARTSVLPVCLSSESACPTQECAVTTAYGHHRRQHRSRGRFRDVVAILQLAGNNVDAPEESKGQPEGEERGIPRATIEQL